MLLLGPAALRLALLLGGGWLLVLAGGGTAARTRRHLHSNIFLVMKLAKI